MRKFIISTLFLIFTVTTTSADTADLGPAIGTKIPHDLAVQDDQGKARNFKDLVGENGAVLVFYRSAKWCPFCQRQLIELNKSAANEAKALGYNMVGISYDAVASINKFKIKNSISYPLLSDDGSKIIDAFGIRNEQHKEGHFAYGIPHPIIIITDKNGIIKAKLREEGYRNRPETEVILDTLKSL
jgi:peroxiredoxin